MPSKNKKVNGPAPTRVVRSFIIVAVIAILMGVSAKMAMHGLNKKMGIESDEDTQLVDTLVTEESIEAVVMPEFDPSLVTEIGASVWVPDWKTTPCSIYVTVDSDPILDSLPESPGAASANTELQLLVELWAGHSGYDTIELKRVWVFVSGDTCFVDLPRSGDWQGVVRTIEGRFVSYTLLFPFVAGEILEGFEDGIPVRGVLSNW